MGDNYSSELQYNQVPKKLSGLKPGDLLVILARLQNYVKGEYFPGTEKIYIVGWMRIQEIVDYQKTDPTLIESWLDPKNSKKNSHFLCADGNIDLFCKNWNVVAIGDPNQGGQFKYAIPFSYGPSTISGRHQGFQITNEMLNYIDDNHELVHMIRSL